MTSRLVEVLTTPLRAFISHDQRTYWLYLGAAVVLAAFGILRSARAMQREGRVGSWRSLPLAQAFLHRSARVDYVYFFLGRMLFFVVLFPLLLTATWWSETVQYLLSAIAPPLNWNPPAPLLCSLLVSLGVVVAMDLAIFLSHFLFHRIPLLWEFHKVHHSAEVLNPLTIYRIHPLEEVLTITVSAVCSGGLYGIALFIFGDSVRMLAIGTLNVFLFFFYFFGFNLRHSPAPIGYKPFFERFLISPAQHHIHHSSSEAYYDKNFGFIFSIWDRLFGTLVLSSKGEQIIYGIGGEEREYSSAARLFVLPFVKAARRLRSNMRR